MTEVKKRLQSLDLMRQLALVLMFASHSTKAYLQLNANVDILTLVPMKIALLIEPLSSALFLFVSGYCLVLATRRWSWSKFAKRGVGLILASHLLYAYQNQSFSPFGQASGILELIGLGWLMAPFWKLTHSWLTSAITIGLAFAASLLWAQSPPLGLINQGAFPFLPHLIYFAGGVFWARLNHLWQEKGSLRGPKTSWILLLFTLLILIGVTRGQIFSERLTAEGYWQPKPLLVFFCLAGAGWLQLVLENYRFFAAAFWIRLTFLSRHSLLAYLAHLVFLQEISPYLDLKTYPLLNLAFLFGGCLITSRLAAKILTRPPIPKKASADGH